MTTTDNTNKTKEKKEMTEKQAYARLTAMCARSEHSSRQLLDRMTLWQLDEETQQRLLARLVSERYVDGARYCEMFVNDRVKFGKWGRYKIEMMLRQRGIDSDIYTPVLDAIDDDSYLEVLRPMLLSKSKTVKASSDYQRHYKLLTYGIGRGYDIDLVKRCLEEYIECDTCCDEDM